MVTQIGVRSKRVLLEISEGSVNASYIVKKYISKRLEFRRKLNGYANIDSGKDYKGAVHTKIFKLRSDKKTLLIRLQFRQWQ